MKAVVLLLLICAISSHDTYKENVKEFIIALMKTVKGSSWNLNPNCLDDSYDKYMSNLIDSINKESLTSSLLYGSKIIEEIGKDCPIDDLKILYHDVHELAFSGQLFTKTISHPRELFAILKPFINDKHATPREYGEFLGGYFNIILAATEDEATPETPKTSANALIFLGDTDDHFNPGLFFQGFVKGISKSGETTCFSNLKNYNGKVKTTVQEIFTNFKTKSYKAAFTTFLQLITIFMEIDKECSFAKSAANILFVKSTIGMAKFMYNVTTNGFTIYDNVNKAVSNYHNFDYLESGRSLGIAFRLAFGVTIG
jgi:hypothetical protein